MANDDGGASDEKGQVFPWLRLPPELQARTVDYVVSEAAKGTVWQAQEAFKNVALAHPTMRNATSVGRLVRLKTHLEANRHMSTQVMDAVYRDKQFSLADPVLAQRIGERSIAEELDILLPVLESRSPKERSEIFDKISRQTATLRMAGYSKIADRPDLFDDKQLSQMDEDALDKFTKPQRHAHPYAAAVIAKRFDSLGGEGRGFVLGAMYANRDLVLPFCYAINDHNPSLAVRSSSFAKAMVDNLPNMHQEGQLKTVQTMSMHASRLSDEEKMRVAAFAAAQLLDGGADERKGGALALARLSHGGPGEIRTWIKELHNENPAANEVLNAAFAESPSPPQQTQQDRSQVTTINDIKAKYFDQQLEFSRANLDPRPNTYEAARRMAVVTKLTEEMMQSARADLGKMAGYSKIADRPDLFDDKQLSQMDEDALDKFTKPRRHAHPYAAAVIAKRFDSLGGEGRGFVLGAMYANRDLVLPFCYAINDHNPSLAVRSSSFAKAMVDNLPNMHREGQIKTVRTMSMHASRLSDEVKMNVAAFAAAQLSDGGPEIQTWIEKLRNDNQTENDVLNAEMMQSARADLGKRDRDSGRE
ncbi:hypothetical protein C6558_37760 [Ensifer sp. NM-2]|uniref:hypothetical protein n=1 Tax=Ensifer sp. NM-2 TaxID=2109730 RepID=UPI000D118457|nr:hypothetical protein [Ensifer sp. NM-2]PSS59530.1 hypothetical protein C6558_37760 [Ensifer sp. NM-2]